MATKTTAGVKTSAIEAHETPIEGYYKPQHNGEGSGSIELNPGHRSVHGEENVGGEILEHAIEVLEEKKSSWYAYLLTRDFWIVLVIGCVTLFSNSSDAELT